MGLLSDLVARGVTAQQIMAAVEIAGRFPIVTGGDIQHWTDGKSGTALSSIQRAVTVDELRMGVTRNMPPPKNFAYANLGGKDFPDARYWVQMAAQDDSKGATGQLTPVPDGNFDPATDAILPATNFAEWDMTTGGTHLLPAGVPVMVGHFLTDGGNDFYAFSASPKSVVVLQITSVITGAGGKYNGTILTGATTDPGTGNISLPDGLTAGQSCLIVNLDEQNNVGTHWALVGSSYNYALGLYTGQSTENPPRPTIFLSRAQYRIDSPDVLANLAANSDTASTDSWDRKRVTSGNQYGGNGVSFCLSTRVIFNPMASPPTLEYAYRTLVLAADGRVDTISAETIVTVNVPDSCEETT